MVEAQHIASTMKIVDSKDEQDILESLLEGSKPPLPVGIEDLDYLLATPFRYNPRRQGSRFRAATDPAFITAPSRSGRRRRNWDTGAGDS